MGKRSEFERNKHDLYATPESAVLPLLPHLDERTVFTEPCAGNGQLVYILEKYGHVCTGAYDKYVQEPSSSNQGLPRNRIWMKDVFDHTSIYGADFFITNPPWNSKNSRIACDVIRLLSSLAPTWLLLPADYMHNAYFAEFEDRCIKIVSVGRVKWVEGSKYTGKENCAWYLFDYPKEGRVPKMHFRSLARKAR